jgi:hypothetical protein
MSLILNIFPDDISYYFVSHTSDKIAIAPQLMRPQLLSKLGKFFEYFPCRYTFHYLYQIGWRIFWWCSHEYMNMIFLYSYRVYLKFIFLGYPVEYTFKIFRYLSMQYLFAIFRYPYQVIFQLVDGRFTTSYSHAVFISVVNVFGNPFLRLLANRLHPSSKLEGIQRPLK